MLDVDLSINTSNIESFIALIKKYAPPVVVVQDTTHIISNFQNPGEVYKAFFDTQINGRSALCSFQIHKSTCYQASSKSEVLNWLTHLGVAEEQFSILRKITMKKLKEATHEQIAEDEETLTVHTKQSLGVYDFTTPKAAIKVTFDLGALTQGCTRATVYVDYRKNIGNFTPQIKEAMAEGSIVVEDATMNRQVVYKPNY